MAWLTADQIRKKFNIAQNAFENQIDSAIKSAALLMRREWLSTEFYEEAVSEDAPEAVDALIRQESIIEAHSYLTMYYLVDNVGNRLSDLGFVKQAQANSSAATQSVMMNQFLTPAEINQRKESYLKSAQNFAGQYALIDFSGSVVVDEMPDITSTLKWF